LRRLLVLGATAVIRHARTKTAPDTAWLRGVLDRRPARLASVAQANKMARIVWALLTRAKATALRLQPRQQRPDGVEVSLPASVTAGRVRGW
jgi:hypothetical protein